MTKSLVRKVGHPTVAILAKTGYDAIEADQKMTEGEKIAATLGTAALQILGHVAVEVLADWAEDN
jgi:hypothetical protein